MGVDIKIVSDWDNKFGGAFISAHTEMYQRDKEDSAFCIKPTLHLIYWSYTNEIRLTLGDYDDMDYGRMYLVKDTTEARKVFHELLNFLYDIADTIIDEELLMNEVQNGGFFPQIPNIKTCWEWEYS